MRTFLHMSDSDERLDEEEAKQELWVVAYVTAFSISSTLHFCEGHACIRTRVGMPTNAICAVCAFEETSALRGLVGGCPIFQTRSRWDAARPSRAVFSDSYENRRTSQQSP